MGSRGRQGTFWPAPRCETCGCPLLPWLTTRQVARALQVTIRHVQNLCHRGVLDYRRVGCSEHSGPMRVRHGSLHDYLRESGPDPDWWVKFEKVMGEE